MALVASAVFPQLNNMRKNRDRIAQPARGRYFPITVAEAAKMIRDLEFVTPIDLKRLNITFQNPDTDNDYGINIAAFYPVDEMVIYSFSDDTNRQQARMALQVALHEFVEIGRGMKPTDRRRESISFRAFIAGQTDVTLAKRTRRATQTKYRGSAKFSHAFKPKGVKTDEQIIKSVDLADRMP